MTKTRLGKTGVFPLGIFALTLLSTVANASDKSVGNWMVHNEVDNFSGDTNVIAMTVDSGTVLAVRCLQKKLSLAVMDQIHTMGLTPNEPFQVKFRADKLPIEETFGGAVGNKMIEIAVTPTMRSELTAAKQYALRFEGSIHFDVVVNAGTAAAALPEVLNACPEEKK